MLGVQPDLWCFGKVIGGGLPVGAFGGRRDVMEQLAPLGPVYQAGTLSGNPLATAAGLAVLGQLDKDAYRELARLAGLLGAGLAGAMTSAGLSVQVPVVGPAGRRLLRRLARSSTTRGPGRQRRPVATRRCSTACSTGAWPWRRAPTRCSFPRLAHSEADIRRTVEAAGEAAADLVAAAGRA